MATTHYLIGKVTVGAGGASSIGFTSIPATYTDLLIFYSLRADNAALYNVPDLRPNNQQPTNTGATNDRYVQGDGASATSGTNGILKVVIPAANNTANTFSNSFVYIPNYTSSNYKSISTDTVDENNGTTGYTTMSAGLWDRTAAISSLYIYPSASANFVQYSTAYLYGLSSSGDATKVPYATGGDVITTDGTYWYHAFKASGTFTPLKSLTADMLVVAGGGGGGSVSNNSSGAGGAGGLLGYTSQSLSTSNYTVTIGAGGGGGSGSPWNVRGSTGSNSSFGALTAASGGGGGGASGTSSGAGANGGSGGGGIGTGISGGTGTSGQGNNGGSGAAVAGGGGGGAGAAGTNASSSVGGAGGVGSSSYSSWGSATGTGQLVSSTYYYAGGGGGGSNDAVSKAGGSGGGGKGGSEGSAQGVNGESGTANTGGGGGGANASATGQGGNGGSGIVIVRYAV